MRVRTVLGIPVMVALAAGTVAYSRIDTKAPQTVDDPALRAELAVDFADAAWYPNLTKVYWGDDGYLVLRVDTVDKLPVMEACRDVLRVAHSHRPHSGEVYAYATYEDNIHTRIYSDQAGCHWRQ